MWGEGASAPRPPRPANGRSGADSQEPAGERSTRETKVAVIYDSATGTTYRQALAVKEGAGQGRAEVRLKKVPELAQEAAFAWNEGWSRRRREA